MKKIIKIKKDLYLQINVNEGIVNNIVIDEHRKINNDEEVKFLEIYNVNTCCFCEHHFLSKSEKDVCDRCEGIIKSYLNKPVCSEKSKKERKKRRVINYNKSKLAPENIVIDNIDELMKLTNDLYYFSKERLTTLLKFTIAKYTCEKIANLLNIKIPSIKKYYYILKQVNIVNYKRQPVVVTNLVKYHIKEN